jgi:hypothetical protein
MSQHWMVTVAGQAYGPYPFEQMQSFISEGRIVPQSLVAEPGDPAPHWAADDPVLAPLFEPAAPEAKATAERPAPAEEPARAFGRQSDEDDDSLRHIVVVADMKSRSIAGLEEEILMLGQAYAVLPQTWLLTTTYPVNAVRNALVQRLGKIDTLFVVDCTHDKAAWFNFGPESESRIRRVWSKSADTRGAA